jgi:hypothetical protein
MQLTLAIAIILNLAVPTEAPKNDPIALEIGFRKLHRSEILQSIGKASSPEEQQKALRQLANRVLLLQEAERSKLVSNLPTNPEERAEAFLHSVVSERVICSKITEKELSLMYKAMRPRFVHGHLYRIAELRLSCWEPTVGCARGLTTWALQHWGPVLPSVRTEEELRMLWELADAPPGVIQYREFTIHVDTTGNSSAPLPLVTAVQQLGIGDSALLTSKNDVRAPMLVEYEPPSNRTLVEPEVRRQVRAELCPRVVRKNRESYLDNLRRSAYVRIHRSAWPRSVILPSSTD